MTRKIRELVLPECEDGIAIGAVGDGEAGVGVVVQPCDIAIELQVAVRAYIHTCEDSVVQLIREWQSKVSGAIIAVAPYVYGAWDSDAGADGN